MYRIERNSNKVIIGKMDKKVLVDVVGCAFSCQRVFVQSETNIPPFFKGRRTS